MSDSPGARPTTALASSSSEAPGPGATSAPVDRGALPSTVPNAESTEAFVPGATIGRFLVLTKLGSGGMGVVYAAYDPHLDRNVAIKLLRGNRMLGATAHDRDRLTAEAQAMARLAHPNVVAVHELGFTPAAAFLVMEYVPGRTLRDWLDERVRTWPEIIAMFVAAGQGLVAAHRARVVHRDFKPANVLLDRDDRPRVADFGLAADIAADSSSEHRSPHAGTRPYMAPEQLRGEPCNDKTDQFAFCVAVWHAVHGSWPFHGATESEREAAIVAGRLVPPARRTPDWLRTALMRGLAATPEARWPSLDELLRVLGRERGARRRWVALGLAAVALVALTWLAVRPDAATDPCARAGAVARFAGIWDPARKAAVQGAFHLTGLSYAHDTWQRVEPVIDGYVGEWSRMATEACRATRVEGRQSDVQMDLRMRCLDERRSVLGALTELWTHSMTTATLAQAIDAALKLPAIRECAGGRALAERIPLPTDPARVRMIGEIRAKLDGVQALLLANRWGEAKQRAHALRAEADATGWPQVQAEAALNEGRALLSLQEPAAEAAALDAIRLAGAARDDDIVARALLNLIWAVGQHRDTNRALEIAEIADGAVSRAGNDGARRASLMAERALVLRLSGQLMPAKTAYLDAIARYTEALGADARETVNTLADLATVIVQMGDYQEALKLLRDVLTKTIARFGPEHPRTAIILNNLGETYQDTGDLDAAAANLRRALEIKQKVIGPQTIPVAQTMAALGNVETTLGNLDEAQVLLERSLAIQEQLLGREHGALADELLIPIAILRRKQGRYGEAIELLDRALAIATRTGGAESNTVADVTEEIAAVLAARNDLVGALDRARNVLDVRNKVLDKGHPDTVQARAEVAAVLARLRRCTEAQPVLDDVIARWEKAESAAPWPYPLALAARAECDLAQGAPARAVAHAERAIAIARSAVTWPAGSGQYRWVLGRALWALGRRGEAIAAARQAEHELAADADGKIDHAAVSAWLAARASSSESSGRTAR